MLENQKTLFSLPEDIHYLNCASKAPLLNEAQARGIAGLRRQIAPLALGPDEYASESEELRSALAGLINASPDRIAITPSVSYGVAIASHNLRLRSAQNVVCMQEEFPSDVYAWAERCRMDCAELRSVARPEETARVSSLWNERLLEAIDAQTAVVNISSVHWTDGVRFDLEAIADRAREVGALFVVDGTQSIGAADFDFARIKPDLLVCAGYKWLLGPYQIGFAALGDRLIDAEPFEYHWSNRAGSHDTTATAYRQEYEKGARRFDVGEHANYITVPMLTEGARQAKAWGSEAIQDYCRTLAAPLVPLIEDERFVLAPASERMAHIIGIRLANESLIPGVMRALAERQVRVSRRGKSIRISPHVYNTSADMDALMDGLMAGLG
ncbi:MAG: aminotransferase class V-fold PLP-dependent enzyme [Lysobacterales bacterium]|nr:MAG: aminotransferase class V-fold PLP-dependent enzyme [Xanthomonadales bacterium]